MHWCPYCGQACYCDSEDMDWGEYPCEKHNDSICPDEEEDDCGYNWLDQGGE